MKNELNKEEKAIELVVKMLIVAIVSLCILFAVGCEPAPCEDCYTYTYSDVSSDWVCVEYDCDYDY